MDGLTNWQGSDQYGMEVHSGQSQENHDAHQSDTYHETDRTSTIPTKIDDAGTNGHFVQPQPAGSPPATAGRDMLIATGMKEYHHRGEIQASSVQNHNPAAAVRESVFFRKDNAQESATGSELSIYSAQQKKRFRSNGEPQGAAKSNRSLAGIAPSQAQFSDQDPQPGSHKRSRTSISSVTEANHRPSEPNNASRPQVSLSHRDASTQQGAEPDSHDNFRKFYNQEQNEVHTIQNIAGAEDGVPNPDGSSDFHMGGPQLGDTNQVVCRQGQNSGHGAPGQDGPNTPVHDAEVPYAGYDMTSSESTSQAKIANQWHGIVQYVLREQKQELNERYSNDLQELRVELQRSTNEKQATEFELSAFRQQAESGAAALQSKCDRIQNELDNVEIGYQDSLAHWGNTQDKTQPLVKTHQAATEPPNQELAARYRDLSEKLNALHFSLKDKQAAAQKKNETLTSKLNEKDKLLHEDMNRWSSLEAKVEEALPRLALDNEMRVLMTDKNRGITATLEQFKQLRNDHAQAVSQQKEQLAQAMQAINREKDLAREFVALRDAVQRVDATISSNTSQAAKDAIEGLKTDCISVLQTMSNSLDTIISQLNDAVAKQSHLAELQKAIADKDSLLPEEHKKTSRLKNDVASLKEQVAGLNITIASQPTLEPRPPPQPTSEERDALRGELTRKSEELSTANDAVKSLQSEKHDLQQRVDAINHVATGFATQRAELERQVSEAVKTKEREMSTAWKRTKAVEKSQHDQEIKRYVARERQLAKERDDYKATLASAGTEAWQDRVKELSQGVQDLQKSLADARSANDSLVYENSTQKTQLAEAVAGKTRALQELGESQRQMHEAQSAEKQWRIKLQERQEEDAALVDENRMGAQHKANLDHMKQGCYQELDKERSRNKELADEHRAHVNKMQAEKDDAIWQAEDHNKKIDSTCRAQQERYGRDLELNDQLLTLTSERDQTMAACAEQLRVEQEAPNKLQHGNYYNSHPAEPSRSTHSHFETGNQANSAAASSQGRSGIDGRRSIPPASVFGDALPKRTRKKTDRQQASQGPAVEETQSQPTDEGTGVFSQIARPDSRRSKSAFSGVNEMLDDGLGDSQQLLGDWWRAQTPHRGGSIVEETQQCSDRSSPDETQPPPIKAPLLHVLRGKLSEHEQPDATPSMLSSRYKRVLPGHSATGNFFDLDSQVGRFLSQDDLARNSQEQRSEGTYRKPVVKPNSASKRHSHTQVYDADMIRASKHSNEHQDGSSSPAFVQSQTGVVPRTYHSQQFSSHIARAPTATATIDPQLLQKHPQTTATYKRKSSAGNTGPIQNVEPKRKTQRRNKTIQTATSPPSQHTRARHSVNDLPAMPQFTKRDNGARGVPGSASSQSRARNLFRHPATPGRGNKHVKKTTKNDEMNDRFSQELSSLR